MKISYTTCFEKLSKAAKPVKVLEGGSRSGKTWAILMWLIYIFCQKPENAGKKVTIVRERLTWLKGTVLKDFEEILSKWPIYHYPKINPRRSEQTYYVLDVEINFMGLDEGQKLFGMKQDVIWVNEAISDNLVTGISKRNFDQLEMRTNELVFFDYNPKVTDHWIFDSILTRDDVEFIHTTVIHNEMVPRKMREKILSYEPTNENYAKGTADPVMWKIYGLGQRARMEGVIFHNVDFVKDFPQEYKWEAYGVDFGFTNDPTAIIHVRYTHGQLYVKELVYETGLTNSDIYEKIVNLGINGEVIADSAEPKSIEEIRRKGLNIKSGVKGQDSVRFGINVLKGYKINITEDSLNFKKEAQNYKWQVDNSGKTTNKPVDMYNHCWDALRYVASIKIGSPKKQFWHA